MSDFDRSIRFLRATDRLLADRVETLAWGEALLTPTLPRLHDGNFVVVESDVGADEVAAADRVMGGIGLHHRRVNLADDEVAARLAPGLGGLGWEAQRFLIMAVRTRPAPQAVAGVEEAQFLKRVG